jgi:hypothetical protein
VTTLEKKQILMSALAGYKLWQAGGAKKYGQGKDEQLIYDTYHDSIHPAWEDQSGPGREWSFNIQLSDSPDGDIWWTGLCRFLNGDTDVEIIQDISYRI